MQIIITTATKQRVIAVFANQKIIAAAAIQHVGQMIAGYEITAAATNCVLKVDQPGYGEVVEQLR